VNLIHYATGVKFFYRTKIATMAAVFLLATIVLSSTPAPAIAAVEQTETSETTYQVVEGNSPYILVESTITQSNNKPPKVESYSCTMYRQESYESYESYRSYDYLYSYWVSGYWYWGYYYPGYYQSVYGWRTHYEWVTRYRTVSYLDTCTRTTNYVVGSYEGAIPLEASSVTATVNGRSASITKLKSYETDGIKYRDVRVNSANINYGQTRTIQLSYKLVSGAVRSSSVTRINAAYVGFCPIGYGRTGGKVSLYIPKHFTLGRHSSKWSLTTNLNHSIFTWEDNNNMYSTLGCVSANDLSKSNKITVTAPSGKRVSVYAWPGDQLWAEKVGQYLTDRLDTLETFTGLALTAESSELKIAESGFADLSGNFSGTYDPATGLIQLSEQYDEETTIHELSHVWFSDGMPRWLAEGSAQWVSKRLLEGSQSGPFLPLQKSECVMFDPKKVLPGKAVSLDRFTASSIGTQTDSQVLAAQYALSCGTVALILDTYSASERTAFLTSILKVNSESPWGSDVSDTSTVFRRIADAAAIAYENPNVTNVDAWLRKINMGALVGIEADPVLNDANRVNALKAFGNLAFRLRGLGWSGLDAPFSIRQQFADGDYEVSSKIGEALGILPVSFPFYTPTEIADSAFREQYRSGYSPESVVASIIESGSKLELVGRDWWSNHGFVNAIGAFLLGDPEVLRDEALVAMRDGESRSLADASSAAARSAEWSGFIGALILVLAALALAWVAYRRIRNEPIVPRQMRGISTSLVERTKKYSSRSCDSIKRLKAHVREFPQRLKGKRY
jgi:hypothetical protein